MDGEQQPESREFEAIGLDEGAETARILPDDVMEQSQPYEAGSAYKPYEPASTRRAQVRASSARTARTPLPSVVQARRGPSACVILAGTFSLLAIACALLAFATLQGGLNGLGRLTGIVPDFGKLLVTTPTVTIDTSRPTVIDQVRALNRLETVNYQLEKVVSARSSGPLPDFLTSDRILLVAHGEVVGGVDLSKLAPGDIKVTTDTVTLKLPAPEILYSKLDNSKTYVYDRQTGIFSKPDPNLETQIRQVAEQQIVQAALEDGILDQARTNAQSVIRSLIIGLGYRRVDFTQGP